MSNETARQRYRERVQKSLEKAEQTFRGLYSSEIDDLLGLSKEEIDAISPGTIDLEAYEKLMIVVKEASRANIDQAQLKASISELGGVAISIAKKVPNLAALF